MLWCWHKLSPSSALSQYRVAITEIKLAAHWRKFEKEKRHF